jgi:septal ring factor EnvC (AmiA/AmiB activator)
MKAAMCNSRLELPRSELRETIAEATRSLALLDADRLEELARSCDRLNRDLATFSPAEMAIRERQAREASQEMAVFARVLEATRANINVMHRLRALCEGLVEYGGPKNALPETNHGND